MYPEDFTPTTKFFNTLEDANAYAQRINEEYDREFVVSVYEAERR
jgi:hypothetical protein